MSLPYTFANAIGSIPLSELDSNFAAVEAFSNTAGTVSSNAQPNITSVGVLTSLSVTGNVSANYFLGNGSLLTGIVANTSYNNSNVAAYLPTYTGNLTANNITITGIYVGNASGLTQIPGGNVTGTVGNATLAATATVAGTVTTASQPNITSVGNLTSLAVTGNVSASFYVGNGSLLSGLTTNASNLLGNTLASNVVNSSLTSVGTLVSLTVSGNASGGNLNTAGQVSATGNVSGGNITTAGQVSVTGNITGAYLFGNGSQLAGLPVQTLIANGNTSVNTNNNGNITFVRDGVEAGVFGTIGNVQVLGVFGNIAATGLIRGGDLSAVGNVNGNVINSNTSVVASTIKTTPTTVVSLPNPGNVGAGSRAFVTDADSVTFGNLAVGGAANSMPVFSDGTSWYIG